MTIRPQNFDPWCCDSYPVPGATIREILEIRGMSTYDLIDALPTCWWPPEGGNITKLLNQILDGQIAISENFAEALESIWGVSKDYWIGLQHDYDSFIEKCLREYLNLKETIAAGDYDEYVLTNYEDALERLKNFLANAYNGVEHDD